MAAEFLSTLSLRRATIEFDSRHSDQNISIHALLAESDTNYQRDDGDPAAFLSTLSLRRATRTHGFPHAPPEISIHALLAESDLLLFDKIGKPFLFLSTLSLRRATWYPERRPTGNRDFYPRSPCGERLAQHRLVVDNSLISIHALLAESDRSQVLQG